MMNRKTVIGYININDLEMLSKEDCMALDVINTAFGHIRDGRVVCNLKNREYLFRKFYQWNPGLKIILSVGGWSADGFSQSAATETGRELFAESAAEIAEQFLLDGIDLDWEYPCMSVAGIRSAPEDRENFTLLLRAVRKRLDRLSGKRRMLTIAAGAGDYYLRCTQMDQAAAYLDYVQLMTYDMRGGFTVCTGHHTNLYTNRADLFSDSVDHSVRSFLKAGVPAHKLVIGAAFYSRMWEDVPDAGNGLFQTAGGSGGYGPGYSDLLKNYIGKNGYVRYWDTEACAPWLFDGNRFISYEDSESIFHKAKYVKEMGLAGMMYWEYRLDETRTLTGYLRKALEH